MGTSPAPPAPTWVPFWLGKPPEKTRWLGWGPNPAHTAPHRSRHLSFLQIAPPETPDSKVRMVVITGPPEAQFKVPPALLSPRGIRGVSLHHLMEWGREEQGGDPNFEPSPQLGKPSISSPRA